MEQSATSVICVKSDTTEKKQEEEKHGEKKDYVIFVGTQRSKEKKHA